MSLTRERCITISESVHDPLQAPVDGPAAAASGSAPGSTIEAQVQFADCDALCLSANPPRYYDPKTNTMLSCSEVCTQRRTLSAMVAGVDAAVGEIRLAYEEAGLWENTVLILTTVSQPTLISQSDEVVLSAAGWAGCTGQWRPDLGHGQQL